MWAFVQQKLVKWRNAALCCLSDLFLFLDVSAEGQRAYGEGKDNLTTRSSLEEDIELKKIALK